MALEEDLKQAKLNLVNRQNMCRLIRGRDGLFHQVQRKLDYLVAMKLSPYYEGSCVILFSLIAFQHQLIFRSVRQRPQCMGRS